MAGIDWEGSPTLTLSVNQNIVTVTINGMLRILSRYSTSHSWQVWGTVNGTKSNTIPFTPDDFSPMMVWVSPIDGTATVTVTVPENLRGTTVTISFFAQDGSFVQDSTSAQPPSATIYVPPAPSISWSSGANVSAVLNGDNITATLNGSASIGGGYSGTVYYRVWCNTTRENNDGSTIKTGTFAPTAYDTPLTISVQAYATISGTSYTTSYLTTTITVSGSQTVSYYDGSSWVKCVVNYFDENRNDWVECKIHYYDDNDSWIDISS